MKKYKLKNKPMNESELKRMYNYPIYARDFKIHSVRRFVSLDNGSESGLHWVSFKLKDNKSYYSDWSDGQN